MGGVEGVVLVALVVIEVVIVIQLALNAKTVHGLTLRFDALITLIHAEFAKSKDLAELDRKYDRLNREFGELIGEMRHGVKHKEI